jgi:hypothetical protein
MTEQEFVRRVQELSRRLEVKPPRIRVAPPRDREGIRISLQGWTMRTTSRTLAELTDAEIDFGMALAMSARLEPGQKKPHWVIAPFTVLTFIGLIVIYFKQADLVENFWIGFGILFGLMVVGYVAGAFVSIYVDELAKTAVISEALNLTGNASAAQSFIIRCKTDYITSGRRKFKSADRDQLAEQLDTLAKAARSLGLAYSPVRFSD